MLSRYSLYEHTKQSLHHFYPWPPHPIFYCTSVLISTDTEGSQPLLCTHTHTHTCDNDKSTSCNSVANRQNSVGLALILVTMIIHCSSYSMLMSLWDIEIDKLKRLWCSQLIALFYQVENMSILAFGYLSHIFQLLAIPR